MIQIQNISYRLLKNYIVTFKLIYIIIQFRRITVTKIFTSNLKHFVDVCNTKTDTVKQNFENLIDNFQFILNLY